MSGEYNFDAVVVGSGITGGWAAKELTEKGLRVLVLERGDSLQHGTGYRGEHAPSWKLPFQGKSERDIEASDYAVQSKSHAFNSANRHFWNNDRLNPYVRDNTKPFDWYRGGVVGGRSLMWGRQTLRWCAQDFKANAADGSGAPWPVDYGDIAPWYSYVEKFIGVNGRKEGLPQLPDGEFQAPMPWFALEETIEKRLAQQAPDICLTSARTAILTEDLPGRAACHYCGPCERGCSTGSYFSSLSSTLPAAQATGRLTLKANSVVERLVYDESTQKLSRVQVIDSVTGKRSSYSARLFFLCASTVATTQILLNSACKTFPSGLANRSGVLGHYLMDHFLGIGAAGIFNEQLDSYYYGNRPVGLYIPRFRNVDTQDEDADFIRGYGFQTHTSRGNWMAKYNSQGFGPQLKEDLRKPGHWSWYLSGFGECLPRKRNRLYLSRRKVDRFGIPLVEFDFEWSGNEKRMARDIQRHALRIVQAAGAGHTVPVGDLDKLSVPGEGIHEMGTARMGDDPGTSVLNRWNQAHDVSNLYITDGSFMTSSSCVNPSLTYMAFTARACDYAAGLLEAG